MTITKGMLVLVCLMTGTAMAQDAKKTTDTQAGASPAPAKTAQPAARQGNSPVDSKTYVIGESDVLDVDVWKEKEISRAIPVRPDGKISLPLIG